MSNLSNASGKRESNQFSVNTPPKRQPELINSEQSATAAVSEPASNEKLIRVKKDKNGTFTARIVNSTNLVNQSSSVPFTGVQTPNPASQPLLKIDGGRRKRSHRKRTHKSHKRSHKSHKRIHRR